MPLQALEIHDLPAIVLKDDVRNEFKSYPVNPVFEFYVESGSGNITGDSPFSKIGLKEGVEYFPPDFTRFQKNIQILSNFGFQENLIVWLHFRVDTTHLKNSDKWILFLDYPLLNKIDFYYETGDHTLRHEQSGDMRPFSARQIPSLLPSFYLQSENHKVQDYYLRVNSSHSMVVQVKIMSEADYSARMQKLYLFYGIFIGILVTLLIYNIMVYLLTRELTFLYYTLALIFLDGTYLNYLGFSSKYIFQMPSVIHNKIVPFTVPFIVIFYFLFVQALIDLKKFSIKAELVLKFVQLAQLLILPVSLFSGLTFGLKLVLIEGAVSTVILIVVVLYIAIRFRNMMAVLVFIALTIFLAGYGVTLLTFSSKLKWDDFANYTMISLTSVEHILLSWLIIVRARTLQIVNFEMSHQLEKTRFKLLQDRMKPHFLFNSFTMIYQMIRSGYSKADTVVLNLSDIYRYLSDNTNKELATLKDEWGFSQNFLLIMKERFKGKISIDAAMDSSVNDIRIPPMTIQPVIENCFKHGMKECSQTHAGKIKKYLPDGDFLPNKSCFSGIFNQIGRIPLNNISIIVGLNWRGLFTCVSLGACMKGRNTMKITISALPNKADGAVILIADNGSGLVIPKVPSDTLENIRKRIGRFYRHVLVSMYNRETGGVAVEISFDGFRGNHE
jgi:sensor histidine kinase YesM